MAKSADAQDSGSCVRKDVEVQLLSSALVPLRESQPTLRNLERDENLTETAAGNGRRFSFQRRFLSFSSTIRLLRKDEIVPCATDAGAATGSPRKMLKVYQQAKALQV